MDPQELWAAVVAAEREVTQSRAHFYQRATSRPEILAEALNGSRWEKAAALSFLQSLPDDVPILLGQLVGLAMSSGWALSARRAIASGQRSVVLPALDTLVRARLSEADADDYRRLAELLHHIQALDTLGALVQAALVSGDAETIEVGQDFQ